MADTRHANLGRAAGQFQCQRPARRHDCNSATGIISGRPTVTKSTGYALTIKALNAKGGSAAAIATLVVNAVPATAVGVFVGPAERSLLNDNLGGRFDPTTSAAGAFSGSVTLGARAKLSFTNKLLVSSGAGDVILRGDVTGFTMADKTSFDGRLKVHSLVRIGLSQDEIKLAAIAARCEGQGWRQLGIVNGSGRRASFQQPPGHAQVKALAQ